MSTIGQHDAYYHPTESGLKQETSQCYVGLFCSSTSKVNFYYSGIFG